MAKGRKWTPEQRKAASERAKAAIAAKTAVETETQINTPQDYQEPAVQPTQKDMPEVDYADIMRMITELKSETSYWREKALENKGDGQAQMGARGLVGTITKYNLDKGHYPDPRERLSNEPRLQRFAFKLNYELGWEISVSQYKTADGINYREPKFTLELHRIVMDEDSGEPTNARYTVCRAIFHEDPDAALVVARENGVEVETWEERAFLDEMRYIRMRDWLIEAFLPPKPAQDKMNKREVVIDGKLVEYFEINSEKSESMPFDKLNKTHF
jgi:hypothetical protein